MRKKMAGVVRDAQFNGNFQNIQRHSDLKIGIYQVISPIKSRDMEGFAKKFKRYLVLKALKNLTP